MPDVTKRLLTDETGQSIVTALGALTNVVDPNGTAVAAAQKLNNMTVSATVLPAGATPTSSLTEVNGHFHLTLGVPVELPTVDSNDDGKFLRVEDGAWSPVNLGEGGGLMTDEEKEKLDNLGEIDIYKTTEPASIASFPDGADGMPLRSLSVAIEPVQDLHGQDAPYPAGGGKNLLPMKLETMKSANTSGTWNGNSYSINGVTFTVQVDSDNNVIGILANGTATSTVQFNITMNTYATLVSQGFIDGQSYILNGCPAGGGSSANYCLLLNAGNTSNKVDIGNGVSITANNTDTYYFQIRVYNEYVANNLVFKPMFRISTETDATFAPYSNICPISGFSEAKVTRTGKNLLKNTLATVTNNGVTFTVNTDGSMVLDGTATGVAQRVLNSDLYLKAGQYILNGMAAGGGANTRMLYISYGSFVIARDTGRGATFTLSKDSTISVLCWINNGQTVSNLTVYPMIRLASDTDGTYEPYQGKTYDISFPSSAGTVYGGTLTIHQDGSGELVVDRANVDMGTMVWGKQTAEDASKNVYRANLNPRKYSNSEIGVSSNYAFFGNFNLTNAINQTPNCQFCFQATNSGVIVRDDAYQTASDFTTALSGVMLVYPLATPVTYQLTNQQVIETLKGNNVLWADTGDVSLEYPAETTGLINTYDKVKIDTIPTKVSQLQNDSGYINSNPEMTGATSEDDGTSGLVPAPSAGEEDKFLSGDGTYKSGGLPMVILSYGHSTWQEFINAYKNNVIVYCRASSNANPATGSQTRMAFMAYVNDANNPNNVEFQYYRSMNPNNKTINQLSDQIYVYKLTSSGAWSVEVREASLKSVVFDVSSGLTGTFDKSTGILTIAAAT